MGSFLLTAVGIAFAVQAPQATVVGTVRASESGEPLAGAVVALTDLDRAALTDSFGRYAFPDVPPGPQHLTVRSIGYAVRTLHALVPPEGELQINIALRPDPVSLAGIEVRVTVPVRGVESGASAAFLDRGISVAAVRSHPLLAEPDVFQALGGGHVVVSPESPSGVHIRGGSSDQTAYLLDGIPVFSPYHAAGVFSAWNPDALSMLTLSSTSPSPVFPESLSGTVAAVTRTPGSQFRAQGGVSTTQARVTVDGPLGVAGAGYLLSLRSGFPGVVAPRDEPSYVTGETGDWLASIEAPAFGGRMRFLGYDNENKIDAAAVEAPDATGPESGRNVFEWRSRSMGAEWTRAISSVSVRFRGWRATGAAGAIWAAENGSPTNMTAARRDEGLLAVVERSASRATTVAGVRVERTRTTYRVKSGSGDRPSLAMGARTPVATAFIQHARGIAPRTEAELMASLATAAGDVLLGPRVQLRWKPSELLAFSGSYARLHQFAQSLRNAESVVGNIFPVDLYLGAGAAGVPVARSDQGVLAAEYRPTARVRLGAQVYARDSRGLLLVAPRDGEPFATTGFVVGSGASRGFSVDAAVTSVRYGVVASYGWQGVRLEYGESSYIPHHGAAHLIDAGAIVFLSATSSLRLGAASALGRRTTAFRGALEWEACNLLDRGCEFGGSPHYGGEPLGATTLPPYLRLDAGLRKHWHVKVAGTNALVALFGTATNLLGRTNVLTIATDPLTGERMEIQMRPLAPLVAGLDWQF